MRKTSYLLLICMMSAMLFLTGIALPEKVFAAEEYEELFPEWKEEAPALNALIDYVEAVTDESSADYIPQEDRIAVFDMDGTLMGELYPTYLEYYMLAWRILKDPAIEPDAEMLEVGRTLRDCALDNSFPEDMAMQHAIQAARAYAGMTLSEFEDFVTEILLREADGFEGMTYGEAFYLPMVEVIEYLQDNGFKCYICSGSDRFICRVFIEGMVDIPYEQIIGMDVQLEATGQGDTEGLDYVYTTADDVIRTDKLLIKNLKTNKVLQIAQEIGRQPVLSFGNSSGDVSMHNYTISNNAYKSMAFMLIADDDQRDYGDPEKAADLQEKWENNGYQVISMANDWNTIYGEDVVKTGEFHWLEELAEERVPVEAEEPDSAEAEEPATVEESVETVSAGQVNSDNQAFWREALQTYRNDDSVNQVMLVRCTEGSNAIVQFYDKQKDQKNAWSLVFETDAYIGKNGTGKTQEGDAKTPLGDFGVQYAFGILDDPGTSLDYVDVTETTFACDEEYMRTVLQYAQPGMRIIIHEEYADNDDAVWVARLSE